MIRMNDLMSLECFQPLTLAAGRSGLSRVVDGIFTPVTLSISEWVVHGDLIILTGVGFPITVDNMNAIVRQAIEGKAAGLVVLLSQEYIKTIDPETLAIAEQEDFPIFSAPWEIKLSPLIKGIFQRIEEDRQKTFLVSELMTDILTGSADFRSELVQARFRQYDFPQQGRVAIVSESENAQMTLQDPSAKKEWNQTVIYYLRRFLGNVKYQEKQYEILCMIPEPYNHEMIQRCFDAMANGMKKAGRGVGLCMAVGGGYKCLEDCPDSLLQARIALKACRENLIFSEDLGFFYFLLDRRKEVYAYAAQMMEPVNVYDKENHGELAATLNAYFQNNENVEKTAAELYIHRNTLNKRLKKIEELLGMHFSVTREKTILYECLRILELF